MGPEIRTRSIVLFPVWQVFFLNTVVAKRRRRLPAN